MKMHIKTITKWILALLLFVFILFCINRILIPKRTDGITSMYSFYAQKENSIDLLILGSSHAGMNLATETLWNEYGLASYILWGSMQPFWNTYYFLQEALSTQHPDVIVLDVYAALLGFDYSDEARQVVNTAGMHYNKNRLLAVRESAPKERFLDLFLGLPLYHNRYDELTSEDFSYFPWNSSLIINKGNSVRYGTGTVTLSDAASVTQTAGLHPKEEQYLCRILSLCQEKQIPIVLIKTPTVNRAEEQPILNTVQQIADRFQVPFFNLNLYDEETGITTDDYWTDQAHLNTNGSRKVSSWLGKQLKTMYSLADHRGDPAYQSWEENSALLEQAYQALIADDTLLE